MLAPATTQTVFGLLKSSGVFAAFESESTMPLKKKGTCTLSSCGPGQPGV
jgi:hypothetical protein